MTDEEFEVLDELYFVQPYGYLKETLGWEDGKLLATLQSLYANERIKCLEEPDKEIFEQVDVLEKGIDLFYLATKKGLMEHNAL